MKHKSGLLVQSDLLVQHILLVHSALMVQSSLSVQSAHLVVSTSDDIRLHVENTHACLKFRLHVEPQRNSTFHVNFEHAVEPVDIQLDSDKIAC